MALREAQEEGAFDAVLLNEKNRVVETAARNLFIVRDGVLRTPPTYDGALPGVTRAAVLQLARAKKLKAKESSLTIEEVRGAEELFITGSGVGVLGIASVDGHRYATAAPITQALRSAYAELLETESKW